MFKLTIELKSAQELADLVVKLGAVPATASVEEVKVETPKVEVAKTAKKTKEKAPEVFEQPVPPVIEEKKEPPFDRQAAITLATETVKELTSLGLAGTELAEHLATLYALAGCPIGIKISQLSDEQLKAFMPLFVEKAVQLKKPKASESFI